MSVIRNHEGKTAEQLRRELESDYSSDIMEN